MVYKIPHQSAVKLPSMYRTVFLATLLALIPLLAACPGEVIPPCTGDDCPQPCANVGEAKFTTTKGTFQSNGTTFKSCYTRGTPDSVTFAIQPTAKANLSAPRAVVVFDIVSLDAGDQFPSVILDVIDRNSLEVTPDIFSGTLPMSDVSDGLSATLSFKIKTNAKLGNFALVISTFRLQEGQKPDDVTSDINALVGRASYNFAVE